MTLDLLNDQNINTQDDIDLNAPLEDDDKDYVAELVGEGKKFKTLNKLAQSKVESDKYIAIQNKRMDELRADYLRLNEQYNAGQKLKEYLDRLDKSGENSTSKEPNANEENVTPTFKQDDIEKLITHKLAEIEVSKKSEENYNTVLEKLTEKYGDNYTSVLKKQADLLGLSKEDVNQLAMKSPKAFFKVLELDQETKGVNFEAPARSSQNSVFTPNSGKRDESYYDNLRLNNPKVYFEPKTQVQMHMDAKLPGFFKQK